MNRHLRRLEEGVTVRLPTDEEGFTGRECPNPECESYFLVKFGTGLRGENLPCHCPYCGHTAPHDHFYTQEQLLYLQSIAAREAAKAVGEVFREIDRDLRRKTRGGLIQLSLEFRERYHPIRYYAERQVETLVVCQECTLEYKVFGLFAFCPDCRVHNSMQILQNNLDLAMKQLGLALGQSEPEFASHLVKNTLEDCVSAFDGFGRAVCFAHRDASAKPDKATDIRFQNLLGTDDLLQSLFGFRLSTMLPAEDWNTVNRCFQKRHVIAHRSGVIDDEYVKKANDPHAVRGRLIGVSPDEVSELVAQLRNLGASLSSALALLPRK